jgi:hypothetical protein
MLMKRMLKFKGAISPAKWGVNTRDNLAEIKKIQIPQSFGPALIHY